MTVNGEAGALLFVDGKTSGRLPLSAPLLLSAGAHRFRIDVRGSRYESDVLMIPSGRVVELSLTRGTKGTAIAVLIDADDVAGCAAAESTTASGWRCGARRKRGAAEHAVLVPRAAAGARPRDCQGDVDCQLSSARASMPASSWPSSFPVWPARATAARPRILPSQRCGLRGGSDVSTTQRASPPPKPVPLRERVISPGIAGPSGAAACLGRCPPWPGLALGPHHASGAKISVAGRLRGDDYSGRPPLAESTPWSSKWLALSALRPASTSPPRS